MAATTIIAEIGENHHGAWDIAARMAELAARSGANLVKFQSYRAEEVSPDDPDYDWFCRVALPDEQHFALKQLVEQCGAQFMSSPFTPSRARFLCEDLGCAAVKVASSVLTNLEMLDVINAHAATVKRVYLSTGMGTVDEIGQALAHLDRIEQVTILHCVSQYPTPPRLANLRALVTLQQAFPAYPIGYSDHTVGIFACLAAVTLGATALEKHFTLSRYLPGEDHIGAFEPEELAQLRRQTDELAEMLGTGEKIPAAEELAIRDRARGRFHDPPR